MTANTALVSIPGKTAVNMKAIGKMESNMEKEFIDKPTVSRDVVVGKRVNVCSG